MTSLSAPTSGGITSAKINVPLGRQQPAEQRQQPRKLLGGEILRDRVRHDQVEACVRQPLHVLRVRSP